MIAAILLPQVDGGGPRVVRATTPTCLSKVLRAFRLV